MFILNSVIFSIIFRVAISVDSCETPNGQEGDCKPINHCPPIFDLFVDGVNISEDSKTFLKKSHCGFDRHYPKVCCPIGSSLPPISSDLLPKSPDCGSELESKIFGGDKTAIDEFPWMARLIYNKKGELKALCGGFLISRRYVLTARHCLQNNLVRVRLGEWDTSTNPDCMVTKFGSDCAPVFLDVPIEEQIPYDGPGNVLQNDIALLRLNQNVKFHDFVKPICLPTSSDLMTRSHVGDKLIVTGWGRTETSKSSFLKLKVQVPVVDVGLCDRALKQFGDPDLVTKNPICAGGEQGKDSCTGDSGGPLMYKKRDWYAVGIVSFGVSNPCGKRDTPSVYVRVASHINWIVSKMRP